ncbi:MAG: UPF0182 family protein [Kineosporiaceae bacterium]
MSFEREPRSVPRPVVQRRRRGALAPTLAILGVVVVLGLLLSSVWTNVLWYRSVGFTAIYRTELLTKGTLFVVGALVMGAAVFASLAVAYRSRPVYAPVSTEQASLDRYRDSIEPLRRVVVIGVPIALGLFAGSAASQQWQTFLLWWNRVPFGTRDEQFSMDIGFFVFTLPWLQFISGFLTAVVFLAGLAAIITHYLYGGIRLQGAGPRLTDAARIHLATLAAAFLLLRAVDYWLGRFALTTKDSQRITGLTYTDANAVLISRGVLAGIALIVAVLFVVAAVVDRLRMLPLYGVVLLVVSAILIGGIYPAVVQRFQVRPNEQAREADFIAKNLRATKTAYGIADVEKSEYRAQTETTRDKLRQDAATIPGIRLIDPYLVSDAFRQLEQNRQYYSFPDSLDVDRYTVPGSDAPRRDSVVAVRELDLEEAPPGQRNWINDHIVYSHGFGLIAAYGNERTANGRPVFFQSGFANKFGGKDYQPRVYFGEKSPDYSIVGAPTGTRPQEFDSPDAASGASGSNYTYTGDGGVPVGSVVNRLLYAVKFRDQNILLSDAINSSSQILYDRRPRARVEKVAPFLTLDGDPYPSVVDGRIVWIIDGYTTTDRYPYSRTQLLADATEDALTAASTSVVPLGAKRVNYMRNSVKATVDAYDGSVKLYAWDEQDPVLKAWTKVFPNIVRPASQISADLMSHLRYPEDLFKVQRQLLGRYHVEDPSAFFSQSELWRVPADPTSEAQQSAFQPPYYLTLQMPGQDNPTFSLTSAYIPAQGSSNQRNNLTGFLAVDADAGTQKGERREGYGQLRLLELPDDTVVSGPAQVQQAFRADPGISQLLNPLKVGGSTIQYGNLLTLPLGGGLLYVQPVYVRGAGANSYPLLQKVLVSFGDKIAFADTLEVALDGVFGGAVATPTTPGAESPSPSPTGGTQSPSPSQSGGTGTAQEQLEQALLDAQTALQESRTALQANDFAAYGRAQAKLTDAVERALAAQKQLGQTSSSGTRAPTASASPSATGTPGG